MKYLYAQFASYTHVGMKRTKNQDAMVSIPEAGVYCVADGMGGGDAGEVASGYVVKAVEAFSQQLEEHEGVDNLKYKCKYLTRVLNETGHEIKRFADDNGFASCGTTAVILVFDDNQPGIASVLHVGDSRLYQLREGVLRQVTVDHSAENESKLAKKGPIHPSMKNVITRAIGVHMNLQVEVTDVQVVPGDLFLICSDGLSGMVSDEGIQEILLAREAGGLEACCQALVAAANAGGGKDNSTVTLIEIAEDERFHQPSPRLAPYEDADEEEASTGENNVFKKPKRHGVPQTDDAIQFPDAPATAPASPNGPPGLDENDLEAALVKMHRQRNGLGATIKANPVAYVVIPLLLIASAFLLYVYAQKQFGDKDQPGPVENPWNLDEKSGMEAFVEPLESTGPGPTQLNKDN